MGVSFRWYFVPSPRRAGEVCDISWMCTSLENFRVKGNRGPVDIYIYKKVFIKVHVMGTSCTSDLPNFF